MPPPTGAPPPKLPVAPDLDHIRNRISLALARQDAFLANIRARNAATGSPSSPTTTPATTTTGTGFSALSTNTNRNGPAATPAGSALPSNWRRKTQAELDAEEAEFAELSADRALAPNAGVGSVAPAAAARDARAKEDRVLLRQIGLGKRSRGGGEVGAGSKQKRGAGKVAQESSESDEEEGRSGLGRRKRKRDERLHGDVVAGTGDAPSEDVAPDRAGKRYDEVVARRPRGVAETELDEKGSVDNAGRPGQSGDAAQWEPRALSPSATKGEEEMASSRKKKKRKKRKKGSSSRPDVD